MTLAFVLLLLALGLAAAGWWLPAGGRAQLATTGGLVLALALTGAVVRWGGGTAGWPAPAHDALTLGAALLAVAGGGSTSLAVFALIDREGTSADADSMERAGEVLRGGAWIGGLERAAVFVTLVAGWPEGLAVVLALKGLARYPELRGPSAPAMPGPAPVEVASHGVAERFIIGTFVSVLWAVACVGVAVG